MAKHTTQPSIAPQYAEAHSVHAGSSCRGWIFKQADGNYRAVIAGEQHPRSLERIGTTLDEALASFASADLLSSVDYELGL